MPDEAMDHYEKPQDALKDAEWEAYEAMRVAFERLAEALSRPQAE